MDASQYLEAFISEAREHLQNLYECIAILEKEPGSKHTVRELFRTVHSLKGMAGTMGFFRMQHLTDGMEEVCLKVENGSTKITGRMIDVLIESLDALNKYLENIKRTFGEGTEENEALIKELGTLLTQQEEREKEGERKAELSVRAEDGAEKIFLDEAFTGSEEAALKNAEKSGKHIYRFSVAIHPDCLLKAARVSIVFKTAENFGDIIVYRPGLSDIKKEAFGHTFCFLLASTELLNRIVPALETISEIEVKAAEEVKAKTFLNRRNAGTVLQQRSKAPPVKHPLTASTIYVEIEKLDELMNQVSELILVKNRLVSVNATDGDADEKQILQDGIEYLESITANLHESIMQVRMVPIESIVNKFPRMMRDLARKLDKRFELYISGGDTKLDRTVADQIGIPLWHLLCNAAEHGIERREIRWQRGKQEKGAIYLNIYKEDGNIIIHVRDDGSGIDVSSVKRAAAARGMITPAQAENGREEEMINLLFERGFSMAEENADAPDRGFGLDAVRSAIEALGGDVELSGIPFKGTTFTIRLPLALTIMRAVLVKIRQEKYAIAMSSILSIEDVEIKEIYSAESGDEIHLRGRTIPLLHMDEMLDLKPQREDAEILKVVVVKKGDKYAGLVVDELLEQQEIVIKSLGRLIRTDKMISGAAVLGDGGVALILDINAFI